MKKKWLPWIRALIALVRLPLVLGRDIRPWFKSKHCFFCHTMFYENLNSKKAIYFFFDDFP